MGYLKGCRLALACALCVGSAACSSTPSSTGLADDFLAKVEQSADERVVVSRLAAVDSFPLSDYDVYNTYTVEVGNQQIYLGDSRIGKILVIDKEDFGTHRFIGHGRGEGPGEVAAFRGYGVSDQHLVLANRTHSVSRFTLAGKFVAEHPVDQYITRLAVTEDGKALTFDNASSDNLILVSDVDGTVMHRIGKVQNTENQGPAWPLRYSGFLEYHNGHIYYAGYSESLIKKYTLEGTLLFSVSTIDNHPGEINYVETVGETSRVMSFSPHALYASLNIQVYGEYCLVQPASDDDGVTLRYLDVYDAATGEYIKSYGVTRPPMDFAVDDDHLVMLQADRNPETGESDRYVKLYDNVLRDR